MMARRTVTVFALALCSSLASACLVANPSFDGPAPDSSTSASSVTGPPSTASGPASTSTSTSTTESPTTTGSSDAASTLGFDSTSSDASTGDASTGTTSTGDTSTGDGTSTGDDTEASATTGENEDSLVLEASRTYLPQTMEYPGVLKLDIPTPVQLPAALMVKVGNAGNHKTTLTLTRPNMKEVKCSYTGGSNQPNPVPDDPSEWDKGLSVLFTDCSDGSGAGDMHTVIKLRLNINNGASMQPPGNPKTTVIAVLPKKG